MVKNMIKYVIKKIIAFLVIVIMIITILPCFESYAEINDSPPERTLKVGYFKDYGTILEPASEGNMGYGYDYLQEIAKYTGWKYEFVECSWNEGIKLLREGKIDLFGPMQKTEERENLFDFPDVQMGLEYGVLFADKNSGILYEDFDAFNGMKVGTETENYYTEVMKEYCEEKGISVEYVYTDAVDIGAELKKGLYDTYITGDLQAIPNTTVVARLSFEPYYYATTKGNIEIISGLNYALKRIFRNDKYFEQKLYNKYFANRDVSKPTITKAEVEFIKRHNSFIVACDTDNRPLQYFDRKTGEPNGISMDILKEVADICNIEFKFVPLEIENESISKDQLEKIDLFACYNEYDNLKDIEYTDVYLNVPMMLVSDELINLSDDLTVAMYSFDNKNENQLLKEYPKFVINNFESTKEVLNALTNGSADAIFVSAYTYDEIERMNKDTFYYVNSTDIKSKMNIGVSKRLPREIISILNKSIARLDNDIVSTIIYKNTATRVYDASLSKIVKDNVWMMLGLVTLFFVMLLIVIETSNRRLKAFVFVDSSTGKASLAKFQIEARSLIENSASNEYLLGSIDVNNFKYINDIYGYDVGNKVLKLLAEHIEKILPNEKILVARRMADNFVFVSKTENKQQIFESIELDEPLQEDVKRILGPDYELTLSIGVYVIKDPLKSISVMLDYANIAKKTVKGRVGNPIAEYTEEMDKKMEIKKLITVSMEAALQHEEFITCMQPKYSLADKSLIGAEVLVRWKHPDMGMLSPLIFIPLFEENGFIEKLDLYMFEATCKMIEKWKCAGIKKIPRISVNVSRVTLEKKDLVQEFILIAHKYDVKPNFLEIEITEGALENNTEKIINIINEIKNAGFYVSIDDFGSGYSSLSILKDMPADIIKIDKEFLSETIDSVKGKKIINNIIKMSKELKLEIVAEGIETKEQAEELNTMGCDIAQGYYFAKPMTLENFENIIVKGN